MRAAVLPALAFPVTMPIGWGGVTFMASAGLRVIILGATSHYMANAVTQAEIPPVPTTT